MKSNPPSSEAKAVWAQNRAINMPASMDLRTGIRKYLVPAAWIRAQAESASAEREAEIRQFINDIQRERITYKGNQVCCSKQKLHKQIFPSEIFV